MPSSKPHGLNQIDFPFLPYGADLAILKCTIGGGGADGRHAIFEITRTRRRWAPLYSRFLHALLAEMRFLCCQ
jgi:hypothetical protein